MKTEPGAVRSMQTSGFGISGSMLKWMAVLIMAIDHAGAGLLEAYVMNAWGSSPLGSAFLEKWDELIMVVQVIRTIGKLAFPLLCFLLVKKFVHTINL